MLESGTIDRIIEYLYNLESDNVVDDYCSSEYKDNQKYLNRCKTKAKKIGVVKLAPGISGSYYGLTETLPPTTVDLAEIRKGLSQKFNELIKSLKEEIREYEGLKPSAIERIETIVRSYGGVYSYNTIIYRDRKVLTLEVTAKFPEIGYVCCNIQCNNLYYLNTSLKAFKATIEQQRKYNLDRKKEEIIASINKETFPILLETILEPLGATYELKTSQYNQNVIHCTITYHGHKILYRELDLCNNLESEPDNIKSICKNIIDVINIIEKKVSSLSHNDIYNLEVASSSLFIRRQHLELYKVDKKAINTTSFDQNKLENEIGFILNRCQKIDEIIEEYDSDDFEKWRISIRDNRFVIYKVDVVSSKYDQFEFSNIVDSEDIKKIVASIIDRERVCPVVFEKLKDALKDLISKISIGTYIPDNKYSISFLINGESFYSETIIDASKDIDEQIAEIINKHTHLDEPCFEIREHLMEAFEGYPVQTEFVRNDDKSGTARVSFKGQPAVVRTVHFDKRQDKELAELKSTVISRLKMLHLI